MFSTKEYWEGRYSSNGNSGDGSYGKLAIFKREIINCIIDKYEIKSVIDFGCGDGNQIKNINFIDYRGYDISETAIKICNNKYFNDQRYCFNYMKDYKNEKAELSMSLDVIFHLIEDDIYHNYMKTLFNSTLEFVLVYSSDTDAQLTRKVPHFKNRKFSNWINAYYPNFKLIKKIKNIYPYNSSSLSSSVSDFYLYRK